MWRLKSWLPLQWVGARPLLLIGRYRAQIWMGKPNVQTLLASSSAPLDATYLGGLDDLTRAIGELLQQSSAPIAEVDVAIESALMPILHLSVNDQLMTRAQITALGQHRFNYSYNENAAAWSFETDYVCGNRSALLYACPPSVLGAVQNGAAMARTRIRSLGPLMARAMADKRSQLRRGQVGWLILPEQDRCIIAAHLDGDITAMLPAGPILTPDTDLPNTLEAVSRHLGVPNAEQILRCDHWSM